MKKEKSIPQPEVLVQRKTSRSVTIRDGDWRVMLEVSDSGTPHMSIFSFSSAFSGLSLTLEQWETIKGMAYKATHELLRDGQ